jgi:hypothetical protein
LVGGSQGPRALSGEIFVCQPREWAYDISSQIPMESKIPLKINIFMCLLSRKVLLTKYNLAKENRMLVKMLLL